MAFPFGFAQSLGVYAFLALIPFLILYLIRPKPKSMEIPSLMFFMKARSVDKQHSFFRFFRFDWIFWIQLLIILLSATALTAPFLHAHLDVVSDTLVFVIDASASSQVGNGATRFSQAIEGAKKLLAEDNTLIIVKGSSAIGLKHQGAGETAAYLNQLSPTETRSKIGEAILLAGDLLKEQKGRVVVLSDLINTEGVNPDIAADLLKSKGITVDFINVKGEEKTNYGIIDLQPDEEETAVTVKNYAAQMVTLTLQLPGKEEHITVPAGSLETITFATPPGTHTLHLAPADDFPVDNIAYLLGPEEKITRIALISNSPSLFLQSALASLPRVQVDKFEPPLFPHEPYDIYMFQGVDPKKVIAGSMAALQHAVEEGAGFVIYADQGIRAIDFEDLQPVGLQSFKEQGLITVDLLNRLTKDIEFGSVNGYYQSVLLEGSFSLASVDNHSVLAIKNMGKGKSLYYGILDDASDFTLSPGYPLFWKRAVQFLTHQQEVQQLNLRTGEILTFDQDVTVQTPSKKSFTTRILYLEEAGMYYINDQSYAVNLLSDAESNINGVTEERIGKDQLILDPVKEEM
ncbi:MAG: VWA domain-containing protein, partial [Nanoarchaeota archaeon]